MGNSKRLEKASTRRGLINRTPAHIIAENRSRPWGTGLITIEGVKIQIACWASHNLKGERVLRVDAFYAPGETQRLVGFHPLTTTKLSINGDISDADNLI